MHSDVLADGGRGKVICNRDCGVACSDIAARIGHGQGPGIHTDIGTGEGAGRHRDGLNAAVVRTSIIDLRGSDGRISRGIQLHGHVLAHGCWGYVVHHGNGGAACGNVGKFIGHRQRHQIGAKVYASECGWIDRKCCRSATHTATIVNLIGSDAHIAAGIQLHGDVLTQGHQACGALHRNNSRARGGVSTQVGNGKHNRIVTDVGTGKGIRSDRHGLNATVVGTAIIYLRSEKGGIACAIQLHGDVLADGGRGYVVLNCHSGTASCGIATGICNGQRYGVHT